VIQLGSIGAPQAAPALLPAAGDAKTEALPDFQLSFTYGSASLGDGQFDFAEGGDKCISVRASNRPAGRLEAALVARSLVASIRLNYGPMEASVECAYRVGHGANQIDLRPGAYADVLFALPHDRSLTMFENKNQLLRNLREWHEHVYEPDLSPFYFQDLLS
jgi:hypothetical protein